MSGKEIMETGSGISRRGIYVTLTVVAALIAVFGYLSFEWLFCRFYVPPGYMAVVTAKSGREPQGRFDSGRRGRKGDPGARCWPREGIS